MRRQLAINLRHCCSARRDAQIMSASRSLLTIALGGFKTAKAAKQQDRYTHWGLKRLIRSFNAGRLPLEITKGES